MDYLSMTAAPDANSNLTQPHDATPVDGMRELSQDEQLAVKPSHAHDSAIETPRANSPLPRELRDHIYSYLLDAKHTRIKRARIGDRAYKFHTSILGVNREVHDEAEEYLYKHNVFVVISHQFSDAAIRASASGALWVGQLQEPGFVHRSLDLYFSEVPHVVSQQSEIPKSHWLVLSQDLDFYRRTALLPLTSLSTQAPKLVLQTSDLVSDTFLDEEGRQLDIHYMRIELCSHRYAKATRGLQRSLLAPLRPLGRPGLLVSICGDVSDSSSARDLEISIGSSLVCASAVAWHIIGALDGIRAAADTSAQAGELSIAADMYEKATIAMRDYWSTSASWLPAIQPVLLNLLANTELTKAYLYWKAREAVMFVRTVSELLEMAGFFKSVAYQEDILQSPGMFHLTLLAVVVSPSAALRPPFPSITIERCIACLSAPYSTYRSHDAAILKQCVDQSKKFAPEDLPAASCSFFAKESLNIPFSGERVQKPDHIIGLLDVLQLRRIDTEKREQVNKLQAERGWTITRFEDYDEADSLSEVA